MLNYKLLFLEQPFFSSSPPVSILELTKEKNLYGQDQGFDSGRSTGMSMLFEVVAKSFGHKVTICRDGEDAWTIYFLPTINKAINKTI